MEIVLLIREETDPYVSAFKGPLNIMLFKSTLTILTSVKQQPGRYRSLKTNVEF